MKKIAIFNGSPRGLQSNTYKVIVKLLDKLQEDNIIEYDIFAPFNSKIERCTGCLNCFGYGKCPLDEVDDMKLIKEKLILADAVILGTPIYGGNVTSDFKMFIDRLSYWMHLMRFSGKPVVSIMTSSGNGVHFTKTYLSSLMIFLGGTPIACENINLYSVEDLESQESLIKMSGIAKLLNEALYDNLEISKKSEIAFENLRKIMIMYESEPNYEYFYWKENGLFEMESFRELALNKRPMVEPITQK